MQFDLADVSGTNQYRVKPRASTSTVTPLIRAVFEQRAGRGGGGRATGGHRDGQDHNGHQWDHRHRPSRPREAGLRPVRQPATVGRRRQALTPATRVAVARTPKAAISISPATIPADVRTSRNPNRPNHSDKR